MPLRLYRYILVQLLQIFALTVAVAVTVIAFGATIKPLVGNDLLTAGQTIKYMLLAMVPMLQFAIPFAAGFATTLVMHRMVNENEVMAAAVAGISYPRILIPVAAMGVALTVFMLALTHTVIPRFWGMMHKTISEDVTGLFVATIRSGESFQLGDLQIYADHPRVQPAPADEEVSQRIVLERMAASELNNDGSILRDVTARYAVVDVYRKDQRTILMMAMQDAVYYNASTGELAFAPRPVFLDPIVISDPLRDDSMTMNIFQLRALRHQPDTFADIIRERMNLAAALRRAGTTEYLARQFEQYGRTSLYELGPESGGTRRRCVIYADRIRPGGVLERSGGEPIVVERYVGNLPEARIEAEQAELRYSELASVPVQPDRAPQSLDLRLINTLVTDLRTGGTAEPTRRSQNRLPGLKVPDTVEVDYEQLSSAELLGVVSQMDEADGSVSRTVQRAANRLTNRLRWLELEVLMRIYERHSLSMIALLLPLLGSILAIRQRERSPLAIYLASFLPAILAFLLISAGKDIIRDDEIVFGMCVMWSGHVVLAVLIAYVFFKIRKN